MRTLRILSFFVFPFSLFSAVPAPWSTPVEKDGRVSVWGRDYAYASNALPVAVTAKGSDLLAGPMRVVCADADGREVVWKKAGSFVQDRDAESVTVCGWQEAEVAAVDAVSRVEFDGMIRVSLAFVSGPASNTGCLSRAWVEIPLKRPAATLFQCYPGEWGTSSNAGAVRGPVGWPFRASVWLGNERAGLCWFCESDEKLLPADEKRVVEIVPDGEVTLLRIHLADRLFETPRTYVFGLEATPVKPLPKGFLSAHTMHSPRMGVAVSGVKRPEVWWTAQRAFPENRIDESLDLAAKSGVKTICFHEDWVPVQNNPRPQPDFKAIVDGCHRRGMKALVYEGYELSPLDPLWGDWCDDGLVHFADGKPGSGWFREPGQRDYVICYRSGFSRAWVDRIRKAYDELGLDGVYLDGTITPRGCQNARHGCGWTDADGNRHLTYPIFAVRRMMRELYEFVTAKGGRIDAHQSGYACPATLGFVHSYWDGEQLAAGKESVKKLLDVDAFRAEFMGVNHGVPAEFLCYEKPDWTYENALAIALQHNVMVRPCFFTSLARLTPVWKTLDDFGAADATFVPYWEKPVRASPDCVKASAWRKPDGATLYVVSNLSPDKTVDAVVELPNGKRTFRLAPFDFCFAEERGR